MLHGKNYQFELINGKACAGLAIGEQGQSTLCAYSSETSAAMRRSIRRRRTSYRIAARIVAPIMITAKALIVGVIPART